MISVRCLSLVSWCAGVLYFVCRECTQRDRKNIFKLTHLYDYAIRKLCISSKNWNEINTIEPSNCTISTTNCNMTQKWCRKKAELLVCAGNNSVCEATKLKWNSVKLRMREAIEGDETNKKNQWIHDATAANDDSFEFYSTRASHRQAVDFRTTRTQSSEITFYWSHKWQMVPTAV